MPLICAAESSARLSAIRATSSIFTNFFVGCGASMMSDTTFSLGIPCTRAWSSICFSTMGVQV